MAVTTGTQAEATPEPEVKAQPDVPVVPVVTSTFASNMTADGSNAFRTGIAAMTAALGNAERFLPNILTARGDRYAQAGSEIKSDGTATGDSPTDISEEQKKELKAKYDIDVEIKDGKYSFTREIDGEKREVFSSDANDSGMEKAKTALDKQQQLFEKHGVETYLENGKYKFKHYADGKWQESSPPVEATPEGLDRAGENLDNQTQAKIKELEKKYNISIAPAGRDIINQNDLCGPNPEQLSDKIDPTKPVLKSRNPTLPELFALEQALSQSQPSQLTLPGEKPLVVMFSDKPVMPANDGNDTVGGFYIPPENSTRNQATLVITPLRSDAPLTDIDVQNPEEQSLAGLIRHELAHNGQRNLFPKLEVPPSTLAKMGWIRFPNPDYKPNEKGSQKYDYAIETTNGEFYRHSAPGCDNPTGTWYRVNGEGKFLDDKGNVVKDEKDAATISNGELRDRAKVEPTTPYFTGPLEVLADGMRRYRGGAEEQEALRQDFPELFKILEGLDNLELKYRLGVDNNGRPKISRRPDGTLNR